MKSALAVVAVLAVLAPGPARADITVALDRSAARPGDRVRATTASCCYLSLYLVPVALAPKPAPCTPPGGHAAICAAWSVGPPHRRDWVWIGRFFPKRPSLVFRVPRIRPGLYRAVVYCPPCYRGPRGSLIAGPQTLRVDQARRSSRVGGAGVTIALPTGWHAIPFMVPPPSMQVNDPLTRIVAASAPIDFGPGCGDLDYRFPATGVAIVVVEWVQLRFGRLPRRPGRFTAKTLPVRAPPALECFDGPGGGVEFSDHGRRFAAYFLLGRRASPALADRARAVLNTLRVAAARR